MNTTISYMSKRLTQEIQKLDSYINVMNDRHNGFITTEDSTAIGRKLNKINDSLTELQDAVYSQYSTCSVSEYLKHVAELDFESKNVVDPLYDSFHRVRDSYFLLKTI